MHIHITLRGTEQLSGEEQQALLGGTPQHQQVESNGQVTILGPVQDTLTDEQLDALSKATGQRIQGYGILFG